MQMRDVINLFLVEKTELAQETAKQKEHKKDKHTNTMLDVRARSAKLRRKHDVVGEKGCGAEEVRERTTDRTFSRKKKGRKGRPSYREDKKSAIIFYFVRLRVNEMKDRNFGMEVRSLFCFRHARKPAYLFETTHFGADFISQHRQVAFS